MDMSELNTTLLEIREGLISSSPFLQNMGKSYLRLTLEKTDDKKVFSRDSFNQRYFAAKSFGLSYDTKSSKEIVETSMNTGLTPLDAILMNKAMQSYGFETFTSKNGVELLSKHFHVI